MPIIKPQNINFADENIVMILTGTPGSGKTTLAFSAPDVVLITTDRSLGNVKLEHMKDVCQFTEYEQLLKDFDSGAFNDYKTIAIDTGGMLIESLKDWTTRNNPQSNKKGGGISQTGYGEVVKEFLRLSYKLQITHNVIYNFHVKEEKRGDEIWFGLMCEGSAKEHVWTPANLGAHLQIINGERYLGFTPTSNYYAKGNHGVSGLIKVPDLKKGDSNDFLTKLFAQYRANKAAEAKEFAIEKAAYDSAIAAGKELLDTLDKPEDAFTVLDQIRKLDHAMTSLKELEAAFKTRVKELGYVYDPKAKTYVAAAE